MMDSITCEMNAPAGPCRQLQSWSPKEKRPSYKKRHVYLLSPAWRMIKMYGSQKPTCTTCLDMG
eukprot:CAMPEP_0115739940 /NCGR_PEP_ID=MMETSP0272-20121206/89221_1 /TAXON_ID=71861 /ORGANISM="Scrippsiella trochoidea, Strain CCMP3099" /LENGTH=63 /DNA_ID=CAMNT_0003184547 /DNA_START=429 /DNA_END=620 /DNA_ORIENTATION=+